MRGILGMAQGTLVQTFSRNNRLRTPIVEGWYYNRPKVGESFRLIAESLDPSQDIRIVITSTVQTNESLDNGDIVFTTLNSRYKLKVDSRHEQDTPECCLKEETNDN